MIESKFKHQEVEALAREIERHGEAACWEVESLLLALDRRLSDSAYHGIKDGV